MIAAAFATAMDLLRRTLVFIAGLAVVATMLLTLCDVILRKLGIQIPAVYEVVVNYFMPAIAFLPLMQVERDGEMISVEIVGSLGGSSFQNNLLRFAAVVSTVVYLALAYTTLMDALNQLSVGSYVVAMDMRLPTWPAYFLLPMAFAAAALVTGQRIAQHPRVQHLRVE